MAKQISRWTRFYRVAKPFAELFDAFMVLLCLLLALTHYGYNQDVQRAIFWLLLCIWSGRGQGKRG